MSFASLKNKRVNTQRLVDEINKLGGGKRKRSEDDRFWKPTTDKVGNGYAVIRFLPSLEEDELLVPFVSTFDHGFQGPTGKWYIENSLTTIGLDDPVSEYNSELWNTGLESKKEQARKQKRRLKYIGNIYVVKDPAKPENEGKVFLYRFGPKIYDKIKLAMSPPEGFADEEPIVPYDLWNGANFKLKIRRGDGGFPNYDSSSFDSPGPLLPSDEELEQVYEKISSLKPFIDPNGKDADGEPYFKSYDELKVKLYKVLNLDGAVPSSDRTPAQRASDESDEIPTMRSREEEIPHETTDGDDVPWSEDGGDETDDALEFFKKLASE